MTGSLHMTIATTMMFLTSRIHYLIFLRRTKMSGHASARIVEGVQGMEVRPFGPHGQEPFQPVIVDPVRLLNAARRSCESQIVNPSDSCHAEHSRTGLGLFEPRASLVVI
jgi:hypothetical protein